MAWCGTLNNYTNLEFEMLRRAFTAEDGASWIIGKEVGAEGTPHLQFYLKTRKRIRPIQRFADCAKGEDGKPRIHWESAKGNDQDNYDYCSKEGKYVTNMHGCRKLKLIENLYPWQKTMVNILRKPVAHTRKIYWIWDPTGHTGKTELCRLLAARYSAMIMNGKGTDMLYMAAQRESNIYVMDLMRGQEEFVPYGTLEILKNAVFMCGKYEGAEVLRNPSHVVCFANYPPKYAKLSMDRWVVGEIKNVHEEINWTTGVPEAAYEEGVHIDPAVTYAGMPMPGAGEPDFILPAEHEAKDDGAAAAAAAVASAASDFSAIPASSTYSGVPPTEPYVRVPTPTPEAVLHEGINGQVSYSPGPFLAELYDLNAYDEEELNDDM